MTHGDRKLKSGLEVQWPEVAHIHDFYGQGQLNPGLNSAYEDSTMQIVARRLIWWVRDTEVTCHVSLLEIRTNKPPSKISDDIWSHVGCAT